MKRLLTDNMVYSTFLNFLVYTTLTNLTYYLNYSVIGSNIIKYEVK